MPIKWPAQKEMQNLGRLQELERRRRKMKGQEDEQYNLRNFAGCEISQPAKFHRLRKFRNLEISKLKNCSPSPLQHLQKPKKKKFEEDKLKRENLQKENKPNNKGHKKITKLSN